MLTSGQAATHGFTTGDGVICTDCAEKRLYNGDADGLKPISRYDLESAFDDEGLSCDDCGDELVEHVPDPDKIEEQEDWAEETSSMYPEPSGNNPSDAATATGMYDHDDQN